MDSNKDLADTNRPPIRGGRHPLPTIEQFSKTLGNLGITPESHVVVYDTLNGANAAARMWWMLRSIGHSNVQVLNGGFKLAEEMGFPLQSGEYREEPASPYPVSGWRLPTADIDEVENVLHDNEHTIIDVRENGRFDGLFEPIDEVAGHIPGAINLPYMNNLDSAGCFLSKEVLKSHFEGVLKNRSSENVIVHCGSGVTACHTLLAMSYAGYEIPRLYVGSWSEWSRNGKPMILKD